MAGYAPIDSPFGRACAGLVHASHQATRGSVTYPLGHQSTRSRHTVGCENRLLATESLYHSVWRSDILTKECEIDAAWVQANRRQTGGGRLVCLVSLCTTRYASASMAHVNFQRIPYATYWNSQHSCSLGTWTSKAYQRPNSLFAFALLTVTRPATGCCCVTLKGTPSAWLYSISNFLVNPSHIPIQ